MRIFTRPCPIYFFDIDLIDHVTNSTYVRWLDQMREQMLIDIGLPLSEVIKRGCQTVLTRSEIRFKKGLFYGDDVMLHAWCRATSPVRLTFHFEFRRQNPETGMYDDVTATAEQDGFFVKIGNFRPVRIFAELAKVME